MAVEREDLCNWHRLMVAALRASPALIHFPSTCVTAPERSGASEQLRFETFG